jgi:transposase
MLNQSQRTTILELDKQGMSLRQIAREIKISRGAVKAVLRSGQAEVPPVDRQEMCTPWREEILQLMVGCKGNLVRVWEELKAQGAKISYSALTAYCRRHRIGMMPVVPEGRYDLSPGTEIQHDTSPHDVQLSGKKRRVQTASAVLAYSRILFFQMYPTFNRFDCKLFLTEALRYFGGATQRIMIDNTHVVVLRGTGAEMVPVPEMEAFANRYHTCFRAHELGDPDRKGRVERNFSFIEGNFLAGRSFSDWKDLNHQARQWCDKVNATYKKHIRAVPRELFLEEQRHLIPLPVYVPDVYRLSERMVDMEGYVTVNTNRYSVPVDWIGRRVEVRETRDNIEIQLDLRQMVKHERVLEAEQRRTTLAAHRPPRGSKRPDPHPEEKLILEALPEIALYVAVLKTKSTKMPRLALRQLLRMVREYPREPLLAAITDATTYRLYDLDRLERMVLRLVRRNYFNDPEA